MLDTEKLAPILNGGTTDMEEIPDYLSKCVQFYKTLTTLERCVFVHRFVHKIEYTLEEIGKILLAHTSDSQ